MEEHKNYLKTNIGQGGFLDIDAEASFMMEKQANLLEYQSNIKFNIQRISSKLGLESSPILEFDSLEETETPQPLTMEVSEKLFAGYMEELDKLELEKKHYLFCNEKLKNPEVDVFSVINTLNDPLLVTLLKEIHTIYSNFHDTKNWSDKEKSFFKEQLNDKKEILKKRACSPCRRKGSSKNGPAKKA